MKTKKTLKSIAKLNPEEIDVINAMVIMIKNHKVSKFKIELTDLRGAKYSIQTVCNDIHYHYPDVRKQKRPVDCPKSYQGVGDERCWNCPDFLYTTCPFRKGKNK
jgi:hypothetical protein